MTREELEYNGEYLKPHSAIQWMLAGNECKYLDGGIVIWNGTRFKYKKQNNGWSESSGYSYLTPILPDPHAELEAEYEQAVADGKIVRLWEPKQYTNDFKERKIFNFKLYSGIKYELRYYRIDMSKLLSWSYSFGEGKEKLVKIDDGDTRDNIRFMKYVHYDFKPVISNMKLAVYNNETQQEELVDIPDFCLVKIEKDMC